MGIMDKLRKYLEYDIETMGQSPVDPQFAAALAGTPSPPDLTSEEKERLKILQEDRKLATKHLKLEKFKHLPASLRQSILDSLQIAESINEINHAIADQTQEEVGLNNKAYAYQRHLRKNHNSWGMHWDHSSENHQLFTMHSTPLHIELHHTWCEITLEDLQKAHVDATVDEEVLKP